MRGFILPSSQQLSAGVKPIRLPRLGRSICRWSQFDVPIMMKSLVIEARLRWLSRDSFVRPVLTRGFIMGVRTCVSVRAYSPDRYLIGWPTATAICGDLTEVQIALRWERRWPVQSVTLKVTYGFAMIVHGCRVYYGQLAPWIIGKGLAEAVLLVHSYTGRVCVEGTWRMC